MWVPNWCAITGWWGNTGECIQKQVMFESLPESRKSRNGWKMNRQLSLIQFHYFLGIRIYQVGGLVLDIFSFAFLGQVQRQLVHRQKHEPRAAVRTLMSAINTSLDNEHNLRWVFPVFLLIKSCSLHWITIWIILFHSLFSPAWWGRRTWR